MRRLLVIIRCNGPSHRSRTNALRKSQFNQRARTGLDHSLCVENSLLFEAAKTEWKIFSEAIFWRAPFIAVSGDMSNNKYREARRATIAEPRQPQQMLARSEQQAKAFVKRPQHCADRGEHRKIEHDGFALQTFTLPLEAARLKVRDILDRIPQRGHLEIVEGWRQLPDGQIEFTMRRLLTAD